MSLNPFFLNSKKEKVHTREGFRKTNESNSIIDLNKKSFEKFKIICVGSSSTQCQEMDDFRDSWPAKLDKKLDKYNSQVFNFGVGAWTIINHYEVY